MLGTDQLKSGIRPAINDAVPCSIFCCIFDDLCYFLLYLVSEGMIGYNNSHILEETQIYQPVIIYW